MLTFGGSSSYSGAEGLEGSHARDPRSCQTFGLAGESGGASRREGFEPCGEAGPRIDIRGVYRLRVA